MNRVWIRGTSGSGKTTLGLELGRRLGIETIDLDDLYWLPEWTPRPSDEFRASIAEIVARPQWVVMGNYTKVAPLIEGDADTLIWLDYARPVTLGRLLRRTLRRVLTGEPCCNGNREEFRKSFFSRRSVIWWSITTHARRHRECLALMAQNPLAGQVRLRHRSPRETKDWLASL